MNHTYRPTSFLLFLDDGKWDRMFWALSHFLPSLYMLSRAVIKPVEGQERGERRFQASKNVGPQILQPKAHTMSASFPIPMSGKSDQASPPQGSNRICTSLQLPPSSSALRQPANRWARRCWLLPAPCCCPLPANNQSANHQASKAPSVRLLLRFSQSPSVQGSERPSPDCKRRRQAPTQREVSVSSWILNCLFFLLMQCTDSCVPECQLNQLIELNFLWFIK